MFLGVESGGSEFLAFLEKTWLTVEVILGIGLMIFIHELGHFLAAKKSGVRVETFSLGFGPKLAGFRKGDTLYQLCAIPLGGFVKMAGENPGEDLTGAENELPSKTPLQRMWIFSAGVLMNFVFAFITFPIIFATGVPFVSPEVGFVRPGGPAWQAGLQRGDKVLRINGNTVYEFHDIPLNIALAEEGPVEILFERNGETGSVDVLPEKDDNVGFQQIRITSPSIYGAAAVVEDGPAYRAGLRNSDRILTINGLPPDEWLDDRGASNDEPIVLGIQRDQGGVTENADLRIVPEIEVSEDRKRIGIRRSFDFVVKGIRGDLTRHPSGLEIGDIIVKVGDRDIVGKSEFNEALAEGALEFLVVRSGGGAETGEISIAYEEIFRDALRTELATAWTDRGNRVDVTPEAPLWKMGIRGSVTVHAVNGQETDSFDDIVDAINSADDDRIELVLGKVGASDQADDLSKREKVVVTAEAMQSPGLGFDFHLTPVLLTRKLNMIEATSAGFNCALYQIKNCYLTLSRILSQDVSAKNLGGIITISRTTYSFAELGLARLFLFLAILSINLGFINILPIPVLDGGHLMFLLIEKIKGSPVNEKVMGYSQIVGLVLILALVVYVTYNDILRLFS